MTSPQSRPRPDKTARTDISHRETEVLVLMAEGLTNREIGLVLVISKETVKSHVKHLLARTGCRSRAEMVNLAWKTGILPGDPRWIEEHLSRFSQMQQLHTERVH